MDLTQKKIIIVGLGKSGVAACLFANARGADVYAYDSNEVDLASFEKLMATDVKVHAGENPTAEAIATADLIVISPGVPHTLSFLVEARAKRIEVIGEIEFAARFITTPIIAITGTNGKTTTTELTTAMLKEAGYKVWMGGNIGTPLIEYAAGNQAADVVVAEISSFQLDTIEHFAPRIAVCLNITADHLDRYDGSMEKYGFSKMRIFKNQKVTDFAILNANDDFLKKHESLVKSCKRWFDDKHFEFDIEGFKLLGPHNKENLAAAGLAAEAFGADRPSIERALRAFKVSPHRVAFIGEKRGVRFVDDSKATNANAVIRALDCFSESWLGRPAVVLIMGGLDKGCDFSIMRSAVRKNAKAIVAIGVAKDKIEATFHDLLPVVKAQSMPDAVTKAYELAAGEGAVMLSPACSSFDMFDSYAHRGDEFIKAFENL